MSAEFSRDGKQVLTASIDGIARVWITATGAELMVLSHNSPIQGARFDPDRTHVVTWTGEQEVSLQRWLIDLDLLMVEACKRTGRNLTRDEWNLYLSPQDYRPTCSQWPPSQ